MVILDALRSWVFPTFAVVAGFVTFIAYNLELFEQDMAVTTVGGLALAVVLFMGVRSFLAQALSATARAALVAFALIWAATTFYPFYRTINPGAPLFSTELRRDAGTVSVPMHGKPGRYNLIVEGHFLPSANRENRTARYTIALGHNGTTDRMLEGTFSQEWGTQRVGSGRRSSLVPSLRETTETVDVVEDSDGHDLTLQLTDLSPTIRDGLAVRLYAQGLPNAVLALAWLAALMAAVVIDSWRDEGASQSLMTTLTIAVVISIVTFRASAVAEPGFPQLIIAVLLGTLAGALGGSIVWRLTRPLRKYLPAQP